MCGSVGKHWLAHLQEDSDLVPSKGGGRVESEGGNGWVSDTPSHQAKKVSIPNGLDMSLEKFPEPSDKYRPKAQ